MAKEVFDFNAGLKKKLSIAFVVGLVLLLVGAMLPGGSHAEEGHGAGDHVETTHGGGHDADAAHSDDHDAGEHHDEAEHGDEGHGGAPVDLRIASRQNQLQLSQRHLERIVKPGAGNQRRYQQFQPHDSASMAGGAQRPLSRHSRVVSRLRPWSVDFFEPRAVSQQADTTVIARVDAIVHDEVQDFWVPTIHPVRVRR